MQASPGSHVAACTGCLRGAGSVGTKCCLETTQRRSGIAGEIRLKLPRESRRETLDLLFSALANRAGSW